MSRKKEHAIGLYLEGIRDGNLREALEKHTGDCYRQHSTGVADGKEGFLEFFIPFLERNPVRDIQVVRTIEDGRKVFVHVYQSLNKGETKWVTADLFDTDDEDRIIEHWDVIAPYAEATVSGRTMVDGPTEVEDLDKTDENKDIVQAFCTDVLLGGKFDTVMKYISREQYDQHNPRIGDGLEGIRAHLQKVRGGGAKYLKIHQLIGQGNFVVALSLATWNAADWAFFDIFRLKDRKLVEHWDVQEKIGPKETWNNSGKF